MDIKLFETNFGLKIQSHFHKSSESEIYLTENNQLLKLLCNEDEFEVAKLLIGKSCTYLADIYGIFSLKDCKYNYGILMEKLEPIDMETEKCFEEMCNIFEKHKPKYLGIPVDEFRSREKHNAVKYILDYGDSKMWELFDSICNIYNETEDLGINITDFHFGNVGIKNNSLAIFDVR